MRIILCLIFTILFLNQVYSYGESDDDGYPSAGERGSHNLMNLVRLFPVQYKQAYMKDETNLANMLKPSEYPSVPPLWYNVSINKVARSYSEELSKDNCFSHTCGGTTVSSRVKSISTCPSLGYLGENIAAGNDLAIETNNQLLCDSVNGVCATDKDGNDGHRKNFMSINYNSVGIGLVSLKGSTYGNYWTQDFASADCGLPTTPIYSAFHLFYPANDPQYIAIYYNKTMASKSMTLIFENGTSSAMSLTYGDKYQAAYYTSTPFEFCAQYYFTAETETGLTIRYPDTGYLQLTNNASCESWVPQFSSASTTSISLFILSTLSLLVLLF